MQFTQKHLSMHVNPHYRNAPPISYFLGILNSAFVNYILNHVGQQGICRSGDGDGDGDGDGFGNSGGNGSQNLMA